MALWDLLIDVERINRMFKRRVDTHQEQAFSTREQAQHYAQHAGKSMLKYQAFLQTLKELNIHGRYLDVGAGPGVLSAAVAHQHSDVTISALELEPEMAAIGREIIASQGLEDRVTYVEGNVMDASLIQGLGPFDLIYSTFSLHHFDDASCVLHILADALVDGGYLVLYDLRRAWWLYWIPSRRGFFQSVRAAYVTREIEQMFVGVPLTLERNTPTAPFLQTVIARKSPGTL